MRNALLGLIVAGVLAISVSGASVFGIAVWKIALAAAGAILFVITGRKPST
jgi:membrane-bound ClpP family serine protease